MGIGKTAIYGALCVFFFFFLLSCSFFSFFAMIRVAYDPCSDLCKILIVKIGGSQFIFQFDSRACAKSSEVGNSRQLVNDIVRVG